MKRWSPLLVVLALALGGALLWWPRGRTPAPDPPPWLADVTAKVGIDFVHDPGPTGTFFMPQIMGAGAALFDADDNRNTNMFKFNL